MKGLLLAGGSGTRLYPMTQVMSKQLLAVYDKPMIYYPLSLLMLSGIQDVLIISTERDTPRIRELLGNGNQFGLRIEYAVQQAPRGLPEAFIIGEKFIDGDDSMLVLGDNIFYGNFDFLRRAIHNQRTKDGGFAGRIFGYNVDDPRRYGVAEIEKGTKRVLSLEEKPATPKSNFAIPGLYLFDGTVAQRSKALKPSPRGEIEIVDLMKSYLNENLLCAEVINRGVAWLDAGTPESLLEASQFIAAIEHRQGLKVACLEEIAIRQGFLADKDLDRVLSDIPKGPYKNYLLRVIEGNGIMEVVAATIPDIKIIRPKVFADDRGYFFESFNQRDFDSKAGARRFVQDNESLSKRGVLRGLHYQLEPAAQTKLVRVVRGKIWDVAVDIRKSSATFGQWVAQELSEENRVQLLVPPGFAHGFIVLSDEAVVQYKVDQFYSKEHDRGVRFDDPVIGVRWPDAGELTISEKDQKQPFLKDAEVFK